MNRLGSFEAAMIWEYGLDIVMNVAAEWHQNGRVPVSPGADVNVLRMRRNILQNDERQNKF